MSNVMTPKYRVRSIGGNEYSNFRKLEDALNYARNSLTFKNNPRTVIEKIETVLIWEAKNGRL